MKQFLETNEELLFNERDFQMHLATFLRRTGNYDDVDVEYYVPLSELTGYIWDNELRMDVLVRKGKEYLPIELKYKTKTVRKKLLRFNEEVSGEVEVMKNQGAQDLGKYDFWKDVRRIEIVRKRFGAIKNGLAVFVTNDPAYLKAGRESSNHFKFSMIEGVNGKEKHWLDKDSTCCKTHPDFEVEKDYSIHWDSKTVEDITIYYTLLTI
ncbi:MAG: hypothetical protein J6X39_07035 [Bacteroidales bacterium]|nr:hypothetical protein [Bacteroidales bacterium]